MDDAFHDADGKAGFNFADRDKSPEQLRRLGASGGKAQARNRRARQAAAVTRPREACVPAAPPLETTAQAMAVLDAQFAWLRGAEKPVRQRSSTLPNTAHR